MSQHLKLIEKIARISQALPSLKKTDRNNFGKYNFVSIDDYYDAVSRRAIEGRIYWTVTQSKIGFADNRILFEYLFTVYDLDTGDELPVITVNVPHPDQGAQTAGASMSYAEKVFMRSLFKVVTGEPDSDTLDERPRNDMKSNPKLKKFPQSQSTTGAASVTPEGVEVMFSSADSIDALSRCYNLVKLDIQQFEQEDQARLKTAYNLAKARIEAADKGEDHGQV